MTTDRLIHLRRYFLSDEQLAKYEKAVSRGEPLSPPLYETWDLLAYKPYSPELTTDVIAAVRTKMRPAIIKAARTDAAKDLAAGHERWRKRRLHGPMLPTYVDSWKVNWLRETDGDEEHTLRRQMMIEKVAQSPQGASMRAAAAGHLSAGPQEPTAAEKLIARERLLARRAMEDGMPMHTAVVEKLEKQREQLTAKGLEEAKRRAAQLEKMQQKLQAQLSGLGARRATEDSARMLQTIAAAKEREERFQKWQGIAQKVEQTKAMKRTQREAAMAARDAARTAAAAGDYEEEARHLQDAARLGENCADCKLPHDRFETRSPPLMRLLPLSIFRLGRSREVQ